VTARAPVTVLLATRNEERNLARTLPTVAPWVEQLVVLDSESADRTGELARAHGAELVALPYEHGRILPWIFQWAVENVALRNDWILLLEADQSVPPALAAEIAAVASDPAERRNGFYLRRRQLFRGRPIRFGGYGSKRLLKLFRKGAGELDPVEQDTRVYVRGEVGTLSTPLEEHNLKEESILFYVEKHVRYAEAFAREEHRRSTEGLAFKGTPRLLGTPDQRILWQKRLWSRLPLFARPFLYFGWRYFVRLGILDGWNGFLFHFLQAFWFRLLVDVRLAELRRGGT
jgi:glycosyltransferase involved in cell wall biosynthesis